MFVLPFYNKRMYVCKSSSNILCINSDVMCYLRRESKLAVRVVDGWELGRFDCNHG